MDDFHTNVGSTWAEPMQGSPMNVLWRKLERLKPMIKKMNKTINGMRGKIENVGQELQKTQIE